MFNMLISSPVPILWRPSTVTRSLLGSQLISVVFLRFERHKGGVWLPDDVESTAASWL